MKRIGALALALLLTLVLSSCGSAATDSSGVSAGTTSCMAETSTEGADVTNQYKEELVGSYEDESGDRYTLKEDGTLVRLNANQEEDHGSWWVWEEGSRDFIYLYIEGTAHPAAYTFEVTELGGISLFDDTTGELSNLFVPVE